MAKMFLKNSIFDKPFMKTRADSEEMTMKEKILGYLVGPFGMLALQAAVNQLAELYYTEVFYIDRIFGVGTYLVMSWVTKIFGMLSGLVVAYIVENSRSSQGKIRPFVLMGQLICAVSSFFMFCIPDIGQVGRLIWVYFFNIMYNGIGMTMFNLRKNMITLATRSQNDRNQINLFDKASSFMLVGTAVTMVVGSVLYYTMLHDHDASNWIFLIGAFSLCSVPLSLINYFYTNERVTVEAEDIEGAIYNKDKASDMQRFRQLFQCRYWVIAFLLTMLSLIIGSLSGYNLNTNFCTVILGATAENNYNLLYTVASGLPMGLGILLIYPLSKKYTVRKTTIAFSVIAVVGCILGLIVKDNIILAVLSNFIFNFGTLAVVYIMDSLILSANDEVEYKFGFRPEGTVALAISGAITTIVSGAFAGVYETGLSAFGYDASLGVAQPEGVVNWLYFVKYIVPIIQYTLIAVGMYFLDLEEKLPEMQKEIHARAGSSEAEGEEK